MDVHDRTGGNEEFQRSIPGRAYEFRLDTNPRSALHHYNIRILGEIVY
jgi:hypothetical protein